MKNIPLSDIYCPKNPQITLLFRIMRISIFFLFFCAFSLMAKNSHSQNARVTINRTNVQLESILNEIESQTDYLFIYKDDVDVTSRKSIRVNNKSVSEVLLALLSGSSITYKMEGNHIVLTRKETTTLQQQQRISGTVTDEKGEPLIGVTIIIKGSTEGTVTDANGNFSLPANVNDVLQFSYIGYIPQEINFEDDNQTILNFFEQFDNRNETEIRTSLAKYMFRGNDVFKKVSSLSGGEKVRLILAKLLKQNINFLILDEPTNHIDIETRELLEEAIKEYSGTVLFVSHDRYFINNLAERIVEVKEKRFFSYVGNYDEYLRKIE